MEKNLLNPAFMNAAGPGLPKAEKPRFNKKRQLHNQRAQDDTDARAREARGYGSWGYKFTDKDK